MTTTDILRAIVEIAKLDVTLNNLSAQRKQIELELQKRLQSIKSLEQKFNTKSQQTTERKQRYQREERNSKAEQDKLADRRKALATLNNYKVQQAAEREIEFASQQLSQQEDQILVVLQEAETLEGEANALNAQLNEARIELSSYEKDATEQLASIAQREADYTKERQDKASGINNPAAMATYQRARTKYPSDPVVPLVNNESCSGCHMRVGPQVLVQLSKGDLVRCPGCGRLVTMSQA